MQSKFLIETFCETKELIDNQSRIVDKEINLRTSTRKQCYLRDDLKYPIDIFIRGLKISRDEPCFGIRQSFDSPVTWTTYEQVNENVKLIGSGLINFITSINKPESRFVGIYGRNSPEWVTLYLSCMAYSFVSIPLYNTLGDEALSHILNETSLTIVACDTTESARQILKLSNKNIRLIIIFNRDEQFDNLKIELSEEIKVLDIADLQQLGQLKKLPFQMPDLDSLMSICYTSGSLGLPKGVMVTHKSFVNGILNAIGNLSIKKEFVDKATHLCYLPLSHVMEQIATITFLHSGSRICFLTTDVREFDKDFRLFKPSILLAVPRVLLRIYLTFMQKLNSPLLRWLCKQTVDSILKEQKHGIYRSNGILDRILFSRIREHFGGQIKCVVLGSAPLDHEVVRWFRAAFGCPVVEGYGSTETCGIITTTLFDDIDADHVGCLCAGVDVKLIDVPEMNLVASRDGMGEICMRGLQNMIGYYKNEERTREVLDSDGFIHIGDIGMWTEHGALKIVDRVKNIFKLSQGEYVSPEKLEKIYLSSGILAQIFVDGDCSKSFPVAVAVPDFEELRREAKSLIRELESKNKGNKLTNADLCQNNLIRKFILKVLQTCGKEKGLKGFELIQMIHLNSEPFTISHGHLTPTMKIARIKMRKQLDSIIKGLYNEYDAGF